MKSCSIAECFVRDQLCVILSNLAQCTAQISSGMLKNNQDTRISYYYSLNESTTYDIILLTSLKFYKNNIGQTNQSESRIVWYGYIVKINCIKLSTSCN